MDEELGREFSTGLIELDEVLQGVLPGDNIVFQVDEIDDYKLFVKREDYSRSCNGKTYRNRRI